MQCTHPQNARFRSTRITSGTFILREECLRCKKTRGGTQKVGQPLARAEWKGWKKPEQSSTVSASTTIG